MTFEFEAWACIMGSDSPRTVTREQVLSVIQTWRERGTFIDAREERACLRYWEDNQEKED